MAVSVTLELADLASDESGSNPGYRDTYTMNTEGKQAVPGNNQQDTTPYVKIADLNSAISGTSSPTTISVACGGHNDTPAIHTSARFTVGDIIEITNERMEIVSIDTANDNMIVTRAVEGTDASTHLNSADVNLFVRWQLPVDRISHSFQTPAIPLPLITFGQGDQVLNKMIDIGMRNENIRCSGVIRDVGIPSMRNVRKQTLLDIARVQFSPTIGKSGDDSDPTNPNAYLKLTIGSGHEPSDYTDSVGASTANPTLRINTNLISRDKNQNANGGTAAVGNRRTTRSYRGLITDITFELEGGRPDIWRFNFSFYVVKNEHDYVVQGS